MANGIAFAERDTEAPATGNRQDNVMSIEVIRDDTVTDPSVHLRIQARKVVIVEGKAHDVYGSLPQATIDAAWPGTARTFKAHLWAIIDNIVWDE